MMISLIAKQLLSDIKDRLPENELTTDQLSAFLKSEIESAVKKAGLVSREEFDAQKQQLERSQAQLSAMEKQITELENALNKE